MIVANIIIGITSLLASIITIITFFQKEKSNPQEHLQNNSIQNTMMNKGVINNSVIIQEGMINNHSNYKQNSIVNRGSQITLILFLIVSVILSLVEYQESTITLGKFGELIYTALITNSGLLLFALFPLLITRIVIVIKFLKKQKESKWIIELLYILFILLLIPLKYHNLLNALPLEYFFTFLEPSILNSIFYFAFIANITDLIFLFSLTLNDVYSKNYKIEIKNRNFKYTIIIIFSILALFYYFKI